MAIQQGDAVRVHFTASIDGVIVDSTVDRDPLIVTIGVGQVVPGFERALCTLVPDQSATFTIPAIEAYGERDPRKIHQFPRNRFRREPVLGETIELQGPSGQQRVGGIVCQLGEDSVWLDFNHPLAGKDIKFDMELAGL